MLGYKFGKLILVHFNKDNFEWIIVSPCLSWHITIIYFRRIMLSMDSFQLNIKVVQSAVLKFRWKDFAIGFIRGIGGLKGFWGGIDDIW